MKSKEELEKEHKLLTSYKTKIKIPIKIDLPNGIKIDSTLEVELGLYWDDGMSGGVWISDDNRKDSNCLDLHAIVDEINKQYDERIKKFCDESDEFEKNGGEVSWF